MTGYMCGYVAITGVIISLHATLMALFISAGSAAVRLLQGSGGRYVIMHWSIYIFSYVDVLY